VEKRRKENVRERFNEFFTWGYIQNEHKRSISKPKKVTTTVLFPGY